MRAAARLIGAREVRVSAATAAATRSGDAGMAAQFERIIRKVKRSMRYRGSFSTRDILGSLVARWVHSGEWERLRALPPDERHIGESVRRFILDRIDRIRRRGMRETSENEPLVLPDDSVLGELIELAEMRRWIVARVAELEAGHVDRRVLIPVAQPREVGAALRLHMADKTQREIASALGISLGAANRRIADGTTYLVMLQGIEAGLGVSR